MSFFLISVFFLQTYAISKRIKLQWPATSHLEDFLQGFQTVMNFLCLRPIVKQKLALQSVLCHSFFCSLVPPKHQLPGQLICLDATFYGACHPGRRRIHQLQTHERCIHPYLGWIIHFLRNKMLLIQTVLFLMRRTVDTK